MREFKNEQQVESKGEFIELPCEIGDIVYYVSKGIPVLRKCIVRNIIIIYIKENIIHINVEGVFSFMEYQNGERIDTNNFYFDKKEAEGKLKEMSKNMYNFRG